MSGSKRVAVYFVASPLQYLAAKRIADDFEAGVRQVLVWYKPGLKPIVKPAEWDACSYMPWPRWDPLPGAFGRHRRLRSNIELVSQLAGPCETLVLHSAVFDTEAINYFLNALPKRCGASRMHARILPDGLISVRRYPLTAGKRLLQYIRKIRRLFAPELNYYCFGGDRIGSDAPFCDRIYVLPGLPHEYPAEKVCLLPPLVHAGALPSTSAAMAPGKKALVVGQPLAGANLIAAEDLPVLTASIHDWLLAHGITDVDYKAHPKDRNHELRHPDYRLIEPEEALESYLASNHYDAVIGVRSSTLLFARQIYPPSVDVVAFGWDRIKFKSRKEHDDMKKTFDSCGVRFGE